MSLLEIIGWTGAGCVLLAYALLSAQKIRSDSVGYHGLNIIGAALLVVYGFGKDAVPSALLNIIWCAIGLYALWGLYRSRRKAG